MRLWLTPVLVSGYLTVVHAQDFKEGFIQLQNDRYLYGYVLKVDGASVHVTCTFKEQQGDSARVYYPSDIEGYGFIDGATYTIASFVQDGEMSSVFLEILVNDQIELGAYLGRFFLRKEDQARIELYKSNLYETLKQGVSDCPYLKARAVSVRLNQKSLVSFLSQYKDCIEEDPLAFRGSLSRLVIAPKIEFGVGYTVIEFSTESSSYQFLSGIKLFNEELTVASAGLKLSHSKLISGLSLVVDVQYAPGQYHSIRQTTGYITETSLSFKEFRIPVGLELELARTNAVRPAIRFAWVASTASDVSTSSTIESLMGNVVIIDEAQPLANFRTPNYIMAGASISFPLKKAVGFLSVNYFTGKRNFTIDPTQDQTVSATVSSITLCFGIGLP